MRVSGLVRTVAILVGAGLPLGAQQGTDKQFSAAAVRFFENEVRPVLLTKCAACHNDKLQTSGLSVESRDAVLAGGNRGEAASSGSPEDSLLIHAVRQDGELKMPPGGKLPPEEVAALARWVELGLPWPTKTLSATPADNPSKHWSFQPIQRPSEPTVSDESWPRTPIDRFILARLEKEGLTPSPEADRPVLIRRLYIDLIGLLPKPEEVDAFVADTRADAYERVVDHVLESPITVNAGDVTGWTWRGTRTPTATTTTPNEKSGCTASG